MDRVVGLLSLRLGLVAEHLAPEVGVLEVEGLLRAILGDEARLREGALADLLLGRGGAPLEDLVRARLRLRVRVRVRVRVRLRVRLRVRVRVRLRVRLGVRLGVGLGARGEERHCARRWTLSWLEKYLLTD